MNRQMHFYGCATLSQPLLGEKKNSISMGPDTGDTFCTQVCLGDRSPQLTVARTFYPLETDSLNSLESPTSSFSDLPTSAGIQTISYEVKFNSCIKRDQDINVSFPLTH